MHTLWNTLFYQPIYNALVFIIEKVTLGDVGIAIVLVTVLVKLVLSPLTYKSIKSQILMKQIEPDLKRIKKEYPEKEAQAKKTFELYKEKGVNPFSGCLVVLLQLPVIFALYYVFYKGFGANMTPLYSFVQMPALLNMHFLGLFHLATKSAVLALLAGISQFIQGYLAMPPKKKIEIVTSTEVDAPKTFQEQLSESMQTNIRYVLPVFITVIAYQISAGVALYWITSNLFTIAQEWYVRRALA
jgi:YidC/Oxa1 family membrane protein insertase